MAYILSKVGQSFNVPVHIYEADTEEDMNSIYIQDIPMGSKCHIINDDKWYMLNSDGKWKAMPKQVQPDWNQNDDTAADYVKNRPFYTGYPVETVLVEESTVTFIEDNGMYVAKLDSTFEATVGDTYRVSWDGTVYECVCVNFNGAPVIGNLSIMGAGSDTGEPFVMGIVNGKGIHIIAADTSASHTVSISWFGAPVVKIDKKYLPTTQKVTFTKSSYNDGALSDTMSDGEVLDSAVLNIPVLRTTYAMEQICCSPEGDLFLRNQYVSYGRFAPSFIEINSNTLTSETFELVVPYGDICMLQVRDIYTKTKCDVHFPELNQSGANSSVGAISNTFTQSVAYINGHLFAFYTSSLPDSGTDRTITLTVKKIL